MFQKSSLVAVLGWAGLVSAQTPELLASVSEKDYLGDVPIVLSVSRLPQRLDETPGAVTILDRDMIRMSGARDVVDLLRLVPGFRVSNSFESNAPQASYHTVLSDFSNHMQVLVDGRSVYSVYMQGSIGPGLQTVALEDIERIEVLRGSNSAAYGARAFLGTINIVTRDPMDTLGSALQMAGGDNGIHDALVRLGWGDERARFRLTADQRSDRGLLGTTGRSHVGRVNLRADLNINAKDQIELRAGQSSINSYVGVFGDPGNNVRERGISTSFVQLDWRRNLGPDQDLALQYSHTDEFVRDEYPYTLLPPLVIDFGGRANSDNLTLQHTLRLPPDWRLVWGGELRREAVISRPLFNRDTALETGFTRVFGNVEWRLHPAWLLNAGGMFEHSSIAGEQFSPRLMLNWRLADGHTLRYGMTQSFRTPSPYEKYGEVRYYDPASGNLIETTVLARGNVGVEKVFVRELGYWGELPRLGLNFDLRIFQEEVRDFMTRPSYGYVPTPPGIDMVDGLAYDYVNGENFKIHGFEYQVKWRPWRDGQLVLGQSFVDSTQSVSANFPSRPHNSTHAMLMQKLPSGIELGLTYYQVGDSHFPGGNEPAPAISRTDLRLAKQLRFGNKRGEVSLVVQNIGPAYQDFKADFYFRRQAFLMLRLEN